MEIVIRKGMIYYISMLNSSFYSKYMYGTTDIDIDLAYFVLD